MEEILNRTETGKKRKQRADERINTYIADKLEKSITDKRVKFEEGRSSSSTSIHGEKRKQEDYDDGNIKRAPPDEPNTSVGEKRKGMKTRIK